MDVLQIIHDLKLSKKKSTPDFIEFEDGKLVLWTASLVLLNHIGQKGSLKGKRVLELGSGLGHLAVGLYRSACCVASVLIQLVMTLFAWGVSHHGWKQFMMSPCPVYVHICSHVDILYYFGFQLEVFSGNCDHFHKSSASTARFSPPSITDSPP